MIFILQASKLEKFASCFDGKNICKIVDGSYSVVGLAGGKHSLALVQNVNVVLIFSVLHESRFFCSTCVDSLMH